MVERLILVKHSLPVIDFSTPAREWLLSEEGKRRAALLALKLEPSGAGEVFSSREPKALETARILARRLKLPARAVDGLEEHHRATVRELSGESFTRSVRALFAQRDRLVFGEETGEAACKRFSRAVELVLAQCRASSALLVSHGTVISLFLQERAGLDGYALWLQLGLPAYVVLDLPAYTVSALQAEVSA